MIEHWEIYFWFAVAGFVLLLIIVSAVHAWLDDRRRWRHVQRYYGKPYDASASAYRPNVYVRRTR